MTCRRCGADKTRGIDCRACAVRRATAWAERNRERAAANKQRSQEQRRATAKQERGPLPARPRRTPEEASRAAVLRAAEWAKANPERRKAQARLVAAHRYAAKRACPAVRITVHQLEQRMAVWGNRCWLCHGAATQVDHVKPLAKGGPHILANLRPICGPCNRSKSARWPLADRSAA